MWLAFIPKSGKDYNIFQSKDNMEIIRRYAILNLENIKFEIASNPEKKLSLS